MEQHGFCTGLLLSSIFGKFSQTWRLTANQEHVHKGRTFRSYGVTNLQAYRAQLAPAVVQMLAAASEACPPGAPSRMGLQNGNASSNTAGIPPAVLHKEAVYAAVGTGAYDLYDFIDFQPWLQTTLVQVEQFPSCCRAFRAAFLVPHLYIDVGQRSGISLLHACSALHSQHSSIGNLASTALQVTPWGMNIAHFGAKLWHGFVVFTLCCESFACISAVFLLLACLHNPWLGCKLCESIGCFE